MSTKWNDLAVVSAYDVCSLKSVDEINGSIWYLRTFDENISYIQLLKIAQLKYLANIAEPGTHYMQHPQLTRGALLNERDSLKYNTVCDLHHKYVKEFEQGNEVSGDYTEEYRNWIMNLDEADANEIAIMQLEFAILLALDSEDGE